MCAEHVIEKKIDGRGWLAELVKDKAFGQIFVVVAKPNIVRGNHYHKRKHESHFVIKGKAKIIMKHLETGEKKVFEVSGEKIEEIKIEPLWSHAIKNVSDEDLYMICYTDEVFNKDDPDTYPNKIL